MRDSESPDTKSQAALPAGHVTSNFCTGSCGGVETRGGRRLPYGFTYRLRTTVVAPEETGGSDEVAGGGQ